MIEFEFKIHELKKNNDPKIICFYHADQEDNNSFKKIESNNIHKYLITKIYSDLTQNLYCKLSVDELPIDLNFKKREIDGYFYIEGKLDDYIKLFKTDIEIGEFFFLKPNNNFSFEEFISKNRFNIKKVFANLFKNKNHWYSEWEDFGDNLLSFYSMSGLYEYYSKHKKLDFITDRKNLI
ncbi:hypothetical protein ATO12_05225 [Aquimarina atlantica]|uniref:Uncharacterized protein n=1 Tax=Aquimarina atlantica TaxID=1317122 RepID=A0A023BPW3_9FLAO|nr:hypothetical protein [Aquimarina atlantica]EZH72016.1 hypothetical protein ATO12_05225 [Aquimarina atlantica]